MSQWIELETVSVRRVNKWYFTDTTPGTIFRVTRLDNNAAWFKSVVARWKYGASGDRDLYAFRKFYARDNSQIVNLDIGDDDLNIAGFAVKIVTNTAFAVWDFKLEVLNSAKTMRIETPVNQSNLDSNGLVQIVHNLGTRVVNFSVTDPAGWFYQLPARYVNDNTIEIDFSGFTPLDGTWIVGIERR